MGKLKGFKTYIVVAIAVILNGLEGLGYISVGSLETINTILGFAGLAAARHGMEVE